MAPVKNILIRLPNWLGDMVMATSFVKAVQHQFAGSGVDVIAKKGMDQLLDYFPAHHEKYVFDKTQYPGISGARKFGRQISNKKTYDIFFCLPDSFSSALMAKATKAKKVVGFKKEMRSFLLTHSFQKPKGLHRVEEYLYLLEQFCNIKIPVPPVELNHREKEKKNYIVVNINSEAQSRRLPKEKAVSLLNHLRKSIPSDIVLIGSQKEAAWVNEILDALQNKSGIINFAGQTRIPELIHCLAGASTVLTTDSGPAHVANALGTYSIVLFGAGNENNTAPYNQANRKIIRLGKLPCEPCTKNTCVHYKLPECLLQLDDNLVTSAVMQQLNS
ncbi:MAG TPA: glycosyltransferase family 9 protein [Ferruginibacter sp.]|nr:glycosyltransferase family 9 protein [Bacteroidota bacterium]MCC6692686.1 glycosyltransferase family 9 protein [Chitinophagaceae bacterium]HMT96016.1 glycosyltransferase family 9 protein [Ferruginibacter sp.]HMU25153.1 glycosyltransferase family 9 protein [Ferruginibacter sp.]